LSRRRLGRRLPSWRRGTEERKDALFRCRCG
jgi:hypothetical protein